MFCFITRLRYKIKQYWKNLDFVFTKCLKNGIVKVAIRVARKAIYRHSPQITVSRQEACDLRFLLSQIAICPKTNRAFQIQINGAS
jgi:hypothetical protein